MLQVLKLLYLFMFCSLGFLFWTLRILGYSDSIHSNSSILRSRKREINREVNKDVSERSHFLPQRLCAGRNKPVSSVLLNTKHGTKQRNIRAFIVYNVILHHSDWSDQQFKWSSCCLMFHICCDICDLQRKQGEWHLNISFHFQHKHHVLSHIQKKTKIICNERAELQLLKSFFTKLLSVFSSK